MISSKARKKRASDFAWSFETLSKKVSGLYRGGVVAFVAGCVIGGFIVAGSHTSWLLPYLMITVPCVAVLSHWVSFRKLGIPLMPILVGQHALLYALPLVVTNPTLEFVSSSVIHAAGFSSLLFVLAVWMGWVLTVGREGEQIRSRWNFDFDKGSEGSQRCLVLAFTLLGSSLLFQVAARTGILFDIIPWSFFSIVRTGADAAGALGGLLGGLVIGGKRRSSGAWIFWILVGSICLLSIADILISAASGIVLAVAVGLALGLRKVPWVFLVCTFGIIGFLNQGKFDMRSRYWKDSDKGNVTNIGFSDLPNFYSEWIGASLNKFMGEGLPGGGATEDKGQSLLDRVDNFQNLTYVLEVMDRFGMKPLNGETYTLVPKLLIPRIVWPGKPRAHEGQVLLNLHFGRQASEEETQMTYIAWGLLPEAVGNFGRYLGPLIVGAFIGFIIGWLERVSRGIRVFSVEGIVLFALLLKLAGSYEMVASVLVTSIFQFLVICLAGGFLLYFMFGRSEDTPGRGSGKLRKVGGGKVSNSKSLLEEGAPSVRP